MSNGAPAMIGRLNHVAIAVPDLDAATASYRDVLGAAVSEPLSLPEHGVITVFVELANTKIELLHPLGDASPIRRFLQRNPDGGMHWRYASCVLRGNRHRQSGGGTRAKRCAHSRRRQAAHRCARQAGAVSASERFLRDAGGIGAGLTRRLGGIMWALIRVRRRSACRYR